MSWNHRFRAYSLSLFAPHLDDTGTCILPASALDSLSRLNLPLPYLFTLTDIESGKKTSLGVTEFTSPEGRCFLPQWIFTQLGLRQRSLISICTIQPKKATRIKIQPDSEQFYKIQDPKPFLEDIFSKFKVLSAGDVIPIIVESKQVLLEVLKVFPSSPSSVLSTDVEVEFAPAKSIIAKESALKKPKLVSSDKKSTLDHANSDDDSDDNEEHQNTSHDSDSDQDLEPINSSTSFVAFQGKSRQLG